MELQKAAVRDHRAVTLAAGRELWKARLLSMHQGHESAEGRKIGPLSLPETGGPNLSPAFVIALILQLERGRRRHRTPHHDPWRGWLPQAHDSWPWTYFRRS